MFEQIKHNMENISGIEIYPILSLLIFFFFFVGLGFWVFSYKKDKIQEMSEIPLVDGCSLISKEKQNEKNISSICIPKSTADFFDRFWFDGIFYRFRRSSCIYQVSYDFFISVCISVCFDCYRNYAESRKSGNVSVNDS